MSRAQSGIVNRPPQHLILAALELVDRSPVAARAALDGLANVLERELRSDLDAANPPNNKDVPSAETGELGFDENYDRGHLTITVGLSSTAFDALGVPGDNRPSDLRPFPWDKFGQTPRNNASGDFIVQVCSDDLYVCEHVVRRIEEEQSSAVRVVWTQLGAQRYTSRPGRTSREEGRALIGFLDGSSNLNPRNSAEDRKLVFVDPTDVPNYPQNPPPELPPSGPYGGTTTGPRFPADLQPVPMREPDWTKDGSYMTVRVSTFDTTPWDDLTQNQQEHAVGRFKFSGSSLDLADERSQLHDDPAFFTDQTNVTVPLNSHVRKANPRRSPEDLSRRLYRRGYPLIAAMDNGLQRGLAFISYARTTSTQFEFIFRAWLRNADFPQQQTGEDQLLFGLLPETVLCGGYYFVPAVRREPWTWVLPDAG